MKYYEKMLELGCFNKSKVMELADSEAATKSLFYDYQKKGYIEKIKRGLYAVIIIYGRSSCCIIGKHMSGQCICVPDIGEGYLLSRMSDTFWNKERLVAYMQKADAVTVAYALKIKHCVQSFLSEYL